MSKHHWDCESEHALHQGPVRGILGYSQATEATTRKCHKILGYEGASQIFGPFSRFSLGVLLRQDELCDVGAPAVQEERTATAALFCLVGSLRPPTE